MFYCEYYLSYLYLFYFFLLVKNSLKIFFSLFEDFLEFEIEL